MYETKIVETKIDGVGDWVWPQHDTGLWLGPHDEWYNIKPIILEHCKTFDTVIQAGGACGMYPRLLSQIFTNVLTFEPDAYNFYCLSQNCQSERIKKFNAALGNKHRKITFYPPHETNRGMGTVSAMINTENDITVGDTHVLMVDDFVFESVGLIYFDIESSEITALKGSINTILKHKPLIICENGTNEIVEYLKFSGYEPIAKSAADTVFKYIGS
jgi:FkbM family methyltransferase